MMKWKKRNKYFTVGLVCKSAGMSFPSYTFCIFFLPVILHYQSSPQMSSIGRHKIIKLGCNPIGRLLFLLDYLVQKYLNISYEVYQGVEVIALQ